MQTAELVAGSKPRSVEALREMNWGMWEGQHGADLRIDPQSGYRDLEEWGWDFRPPGGESLAELRDRVWSWVDQIDSDTVAVCHIGVMRVILAVAYSYDFNGPAPFAVKRNRLFVLEKSGSVWRPWPDPIRLVSG